MHKWTANNSYLYNRQFYFDCTNMFYLVLAFKIQRKKNMSTNSERAGAITYTYISIVPLLGPDFLSLFG